PVPLPCGERQDRKRGRQNRPDHEKREAEPERERRAPQKDRAVDVRHAANRGSKSDNENETRQPTEQPREPGQAWLREMPLRHSGKGKRREGNYKNRQATPH